MPALTSTSHNISYIKAGREPWFNIDQQFVKVWQSVKENFDPFLRFIIHFFSLHLSKHYCLSSAMYATTILAYIYAPKLGESHGFMWINAFEKV